MAIAMAASAAPVALAAWSSHGSIEPDWSLDVSEGFMFQNPDVTPSPEHQQVYFNVVPAGAWSSGNPNVGAVGSKLLFYPANAMLAFIGVWKDCNDDGYVGAAESALMEYRSALLTDDGICEAGTTFNDGVWVREFRWIVDVDELRETDPVPVNVIDDDVVNIWGENTALPTSPPEPGTDNSCFVNPPVGFGSSTGAMLDFGDCLIGHAISEAITDLDEGTLCVEGILPGDAPCQPAGTGLNAGIGFEDSRDGNGGLHPECSSSPLNQGVGLEDSDIDCPDRFGNHGLIQAYEDEENAATFTVFDCPSGDVNPSVREDIQNDHGSLYESWENVNGQCAGDQVTGPLCPCAETPVEQSTVKVSNDYAFNFYPGGICEVTRRAAPAAEVNIAQTLGQCIRADVDGANNGGLGGVGTAGTRSYSGPAYISRSSFLAITPPNVELRGDNAVEWASGIDGSSAFYATFFAAIDKQNTIYTFPGTSGVTTGFFASEWCSGVSEENPYPGGYECDGTKWYPAGVEQEGYRGGDGRKVGGVPGDEYYLRDVDCYDGSVASSVAPGVGVGLTPADEFEDEFNPSFAPNGPCQQAENLLE